MWSSDGRALVIFQSGGGEQAVLLYDVQSTALTRHMTEFLIMESVPLPFTPFAVEDDGEWLLFALSHRHGYRIWDLKRGTLRRDSHRESAAPFATGHVRYGCRYACVPQRPSRYWDVFHRLDIFDIPTERVVATLEYPWYTMKTMSFSSDRSRIMTVYDDTTLKERDIFTGHELFSSQDAYYPVQSYSLGAAAVSPDRMLVALGYHDGAVRICRAASGQCVAVFTEHESRIEKLAFTPDGQILCSASCDGAVVIRPL